MPHSVGMLVRITADAALRGGEGKAFWKRFPSERSTAQPKSGRKQFSVPYSASGADSLMYIGISNSNVAARQAYTPKGTLSSQTQSLGHSVSSQPITQTQSS